MPVDPQTVLTEVTTAAHLDVGHNLNRLQRYGFFYRRLRSWPRILGLLDRIGAVLSIGWGGVLALLALAWGFISHRFRHKPPA